MIFGDGTAAMVVAPAAETPTVTHRTHRPGERDARRSHHPDRERHATPATAPSGTGRPARPDPDTTRCPPRPTRSPAATGQDGRPPPTGDDHAPTPPTTRPWPPAAHRQPRSRYLGRPRPPQGRPTPPPGAAPPGAPPERSLHDAGACPCRPLSVGSGQSAPDDRCPYGAPRVRQADRCPAPPRSRRRRPQRWAGRGVRGIAAGLTQRAAGAGRRDGQPT